MTREELEAAYLQSLKDFAVILAQKKEYEKKYYEKPTYVDERNKMYNLRFANRCLCGLLAPLITVFYSIFGNLETFSLKDFGYIFITYLLMGFWIMLFLRGISEEEFDKFFGWKFVFSKAILFISLIISCIFMALAM